MNLSFTRTALSVAIAASFSSPIWAASNPLDQVIVSATRVEQSKQDYTGNITVITSEQLTEKAIQTLPEALDRLAGIPVVANGGLGSTSSVFLRGHDSKRLLLMIDGVRFNDPSGLNGALWEHVLVSDIERIEILPGSQASIWGADSGAGVINVITKKTQQGNHASISYAMGSLGEKDTKLNANYGQDRFDARFSLKSLSTDGYSSITPLTNGQKDNPLAFEKNGYRNETRSLKLGWNLVKNQRLELTHFHTLASTQYDGSSEELSIVAPLANDLLTRGNYEQNINGLSYKLNDVDWQHHISLQQGFMKRNDVNNLNQQSWQSGSNLTQYGIASSRKDSLGSWSLGADKIEQSADFYTNSIYAVNNSASGKYDQSGIFLHRIQKFYLPHSDFPTIINLGIRNNDHRLYQSAIDKNLGIKQMLAKDAYFSFNMGSSRRAPSLNEQYGPFTTSTGGLQPENIDSREMSLGWRGFNVTRFENQITNLIDYYYNNPADTGYKNVMGKSDLSGWEWKAAQALTSIQSEVSLSYTVLDAKDANGKALANRPATSGTLGYTYLGLQHSVLSLQTQYIGDRTDTNKVSTGNYWLWHGNAHYQWNKEVRLFLKAINLTDERVMQTSATTFDQNTYQSTVTHYYAYSPRTFLAGVEYKF